MLTIRVADRGQRASFSRLPEIRLHTINGYTRAFVCRAIVQFVSSTAVEASTARISGEPYLPTRFDKYVPWSVNGILSVDAELIYFSSFPLDLLFFSLPGGRDTRNTRLSVESSAEDRPFLSGRRSISLENTDSYPVLSSVRNPLSSVDRLDISREACRIARPEIRCPI